MIKIELLRPNNKPLHFYSYSKTTKMNNAEKLEEIKRLCQSIINYEADYIDDSNYEMAEMILAIINK
jgi:hypothetical protein